MTRSRNLRLWTLALWGVCLIAATAAHLGGPQDQAGPETLPAAVGVLSQAADAAILPARIADDVRAAAGQAGPLRVFVLAAVLAGLVGLPVMLRRRTSAGGHDSHPLRARRHTIALRAPPLQLA